MNRYTIFIERPGRSTFIASIETPVKHGYEAFETMLRLVPREELNGFSEVVVARADNSVEVQAAIDFYEDQENG